MPRFDPARASLLARAFDSPYGAPVTPMLFGGGKAAALPHLYLRPVERMVAVDGLGLCAPVLAVGSNAALAVLRRKFGSLPLGVAQGPVRLAGFARVHSAHITRYGAMPATLIEAGGASLSTHLQLVPVTHLAALDASEAVGENYERTWIALPLSAPWFSGRLKGVWTYRSRHGAALRDGKAMPLGPQRHALAHAAGRCGWQMGLEAFVYLLVRDAGFRRAVSDALKG